MGLDRGSASQCRMRALGVVEGYPFADACASRGPGFEGVQADSGITVGPRDCFEPYCDSGALVPLLEKYLPPFAGFPLYLPQRRHMAPKLMALIDHLRQCRR